jgi:RHS repeat-associated protein
MSFDSRSFAWSDGDNMVSDQCDVQANLTYEDFEGAFHPLGILQTESSDCPMFGLSPIGAGGDEYFKAIFPLNNFAGQQEPNRPGNPYTILDGSGTGYRYAGSGSKAVVEDRNGNFENPSQRPGSTESFEPYPGSIQTTQSIQFAGNSAPYTYYVANVPYTYQMGVENLDPNTLNICIQATQADSDISAGQTISEVNQIALPDGLSYHFEYDPRFGLVNKVIYPTGAWTSYEWISDPGSDSMTFSSFSSQYLEPVVTNANPGVSNPITCQYHINVPRIKKRTMSFDGTTPALEQDFSYTTDWSGSGPWKTTTVTTKDLIRPGSPSTTAIYTYGFYPATRSTLSHISASPVPQENTIVVKDASGTTLRTEQKVWSATQLVADCVTLDNGQRSGTFYTYQPYDWGDVQAAPLSNLTMNANDQATYDFGAVAANCQRPTTTPLKEVSTTYASFPNTSLWPAFSAPSSSAPANLFGLPQSVKVYGNGVLQAETDYSFDEAAVTPVANVVGHDAANFGTSGLSARGNVTTVRKKCFFSGGLCSDSVTTLTYDETGKVASATTGAGSPSASTTTFSFSDEFDPSSAVPTGNTNTYLTRISPPATNGISHDTTYKYTWTTGNLRSSTDENQYTTYYEYNDPWLRPTRIAYPDGGETLESYSDSGPSPSITTSVLQGGGQYVVSTSVMDGVGHTVQVQRPAPEGTISSEVTFDGLGRTYKSSNPHLAAETTYGVSEDDYDALGRKIAHVNQDGSSRSFAYTGSTTSSTDEAANTYVRTTDALGRLTTVLEPAPPWHCVFHSCFGEVPNETDYTYDALGNLATVNQVGSGLGTPLGRTFTYDSLSRLLTAQNPETGTICYGVWDGAGNCVNGYDANGNLLHKTDARNVVTNYTYDGLNRLTHKTYSDSTRQQFLSYDGNGEDGNPISWSQNAIGRLTHTSDQVNIASDFSYDVMGRLTSKIDCYPSDCTYADTQQASYDLAGHLLDLRYPDSRTITHSYDSAGRLNMVRAGTSQSPGAPYISQVTYQRDGSPAAITYGNGVVDTLTENNRLQPCHQVASSNVGTLLDRQYFYNTNDTSSFCADELNDNGNIFHIIDNLGSHANTQNFNYDALNRLTWFEGPNMSGAYRSQNFSYDSFGNLTAGQGYTEPGTNYVGTPDARTFANPAYSGDTPYTAKNQLSDATFDCAPATGTSHYDAAGNMMCGGSQTDLDAQQYTWDAESRLAQVNIQHGGNTYDLAAQYNFDYSGNRIRSDLFSPGSPNATSWREYTFFGGQLLSEKDNDGNWTDYIYANGQKIARVAQNDPHLHVSANAGSGGNWIWYDTNTFDGYVIQTGDKLSWRQYQSAAARGGMLVYTTGPISSAWEISDQNGNPSNSDPVTGQWEYRTISLNALAGTAITILGPGLDQVTQGQASIDVADIALTSADGTVRTVFNGSPVNLTPSAAQSAGVTNIQGSYVFNATPGESPSGITYYYLADHLGTTQVELSAGGYPVWEGQFAPFGQELDTQPTAMRYKFTGQEREAESSLDYFGARYYPSATGRFMSPDPSGPASMRFEDPQSLNLYAYVRNNPLINVDPTGLDCIHLNDDMKGIKEVNAGNCKKGDGGYWVPGTYNGMAVTQSDGTITGFESIDGNNGFVSTFGSNGSISVDVTSPWMLPRADSPYNGVGMKFSDVSQEQGVLAFMNVGQTAGWIGTPQGVAAFYGASALGAAPSIAGSFAALDSVSLVIGEGSPIHVAVDTEFGAVEADGEEFFDMTMKAGRRADAFVRSYKYFSIPVPVLSSAGVYAYGASGAAAASCVTGACSAIVHGWLH